MEAAKMRRQGNMAQMKMDKTPEKKKNGHKPSITYRAQNTGYSDAQGTHWYFNSIKQTQAEIKVTLSEIKKKLQGTNSGVDEAENQINDLEHKEEKSIQSKQQKEKRFQKTRIGYGASGTTSNIPTFKS